MIPPIHLTFVSHNEEPGSDHPDYLSDRSFYLENRERVHCLALLLKGKDARLNFQSDWNFLQAVRMYDVGEVTSNSNGKNIVQWLVEDMGFEADPHAHETQYNYADVAFLHTLLGVEPSKTVGGFLYLPPDNPHGWEQHREGISGRMHPDYFWKADLLWGAATMNHQGSDDQSSGVWKPFDRFEFTRHDPSQRLVYIGGGCVLMQDRESPDFSSMERILKALDTKNVPLDGFYTATVFIPQQCIDPRMLREVGENLDRLAPLVQQGRIIWSPLSRIARIWQTSHGGKPFRLDCSRIP